MKKALLSLLAVGGLLLGPGVCWAQPAAGTMSSLVTVAFSGYDAVKSDVAYLANLSGKPEMVDGLEAMLNMMTGGQGLAGLDTTRPWGAVAQTDGQQFAVFGFVPVTDLAKLMEVVGNLDVQVNDTGGGVYEIQAEDNSVYVQQKGSWAVVAQSPEALAAAPADPAALLGDLPTRYDLAVQGSVKNIPPGIRQLLLLNLEMGAQAALARQPGETEEQYALRAGMARRSIDQFQKLFEELDTLLVGFAIDSQAGLAYLDIEMTAIPGTDLAQDFAQTGPATTNFAGFDLPGAALTANICGPLSDADVEQAKATLAEAQATALKELEQESLPEADRALAARLINDLFDVVEKTLETRKADLGAVVLLDPSAVTVAAGGAIAEGDKLEAALKALIAKAQEEEPELAGMIQLDAGEYQGLRLHKLNIPVPENEEEARQMFGPTLEMVLAINNQTVYLVVGSNAEGVLQQIVDKSAQEPGKTVLPMRLAVAATPIAKFVAGVAQDDPQTAAMAGMVAQILAGKPGQDRVTLTAEPVPNGVRMRIAVEEGLLSVPGQLAPIGGEMPGADAPLPGGFEDAPVQPAPF